ncbi:MAG: hypothetical protein K6F53_10815 [Lachnospiraceae bacterium]|nr:hypothetical protein [Lachnospiraceae bacterium]
MPSDFEKEYKEYIESDMPDLWGRIEAGIAKEQAGGSKTRESEIGFTKAQAGGRKTRESEIGLTKAQAVGNGEENTITSAVPEIQKDRVVRWPFAVRRIGQIAAVAAIGLVSLGAVMMFSRGKNLSTAKNAASEAAAPAPMEAAESASEAAYEDAADSWDMAEAAADYAAPEEAEASRNDAAETSGMADATYDTGTATAAESEEAAEYAAEYSDAEDDMKDAAEAEKNEKTARGSLMIGEDYDPDRILMVEKAELLSVRELSEEEEEDFRDASDKEYRYILEFRDNDRTIRCLLSEENAEKAESTGRLPVAGDACRIFLMEIPGIEGSDPSFELIGFGE